MTSNIAEKAKAYTNMNLYNNIPEQMKGKTLVITSELAVLHL